MKLVYITSKTFPSAKVEPFIIKSQAEAFSRLLDKDFTLFIRGRVPQEFHQMNTESVMAPPRLKALFYFIAMPYLILSHRWNDREVVFFSSDPYILASLIFWRKLFGFKYRICSEWHQLFDNWVDRYVSRNGDYLVTTSKRLAGFISAVFNIPLDKIEVPYMGVNQSLIAKNSSTDKDSCRDRVGLDSKVFLVGYAGAYKAMHKVEKGIKTMIEAIPHIDKGIKMAFVGGTSQEIMEYEDIARGIGVLDRCLFVEKQPFERLVEYEVAMDVLVIANPDTNYYRNYCFPFKVWEYLASGRPIIYSNLEIIDEVLSGRGTSFQVGDPKDLARAITLVHKDIVAKESQARENLDIIKRYTWDARAEKIISLLKH